MLRDIVFKEIENKGFIPFDRFVELCLYHPEFGYYTTKRLSLEKGEDFITAPELTPAFGKVVAAYVSELSEETGIPLNILELGGGKGYLAASFLKTVRPESYYIFEVSKRELVVDAKVVTSLDDVPSFSGFIVANEFFDAFPFKRIRRIGGKLFEAVITVGSRGNLEEDFIPFSEELPCTPEEGCEYGFFIGWEEFLDKLLSKVENAVFLCFDYGDTCDRLRMQGTSFRAFRGNRLVNDYLERLGETDLTAFVDFTYLGRILKKFFSNVEVIPQSKFLLENGIDRFISPEEASNALMLLVDMGRRFKVLIGRD